jgi:hypothetical protein
MTHHNQIKKLIIWFLNLPLDESIDNKSIKFKVRRPKKPRKAQEGHLEEGQPQKPTKGKKRGKAK